MKSKVEYVKYEKDLCFKCLQRKKNIKTYKIENRGYGSDYDGFSSELQICEDCLEGKHEELEKWFNETCEYDSGNYLEEYKYENNIAEYIKTLPIQGQELFENQISCGFGAYNMDSQDWIDIELKIASDSTYKKYGFYTPSEKKAYYDRFPTCKHVYLKIYKDGSKATRCDVHFGVSGNEDGSCGINICNACYYCNHYEKRNFDKDKMRIDKTIKVDYNIIEMVEVFCPMCGTKTHMYRNNLNEEFCCDNCGQELFIDTEGLFEEE